MTKTEMIEKMLTLLNSLHRDELLEFFSQRSEKDRRALAPEALRWIKSQEYVLISLPFGMTSDFHGNALLGHEVLSQLRTIGAVSQVTRGKSPHIMLDNEDLSKIIEVEKTQASAFQENEFSKVENRPQLLEVALIALASTASCSELLNHWRHLIPPVMTRSIEILVQVFHDRKPDWLPEFLDDFFTTESGRFWPIWRILPREGTCPSFRADSIYYALFDFADSLSLEKGKYSVRKWLDFWKDNSDLLDDFLYPFEHSMRPAKKNGNHCFCPTDPTLYSALIENELIDRNRFLNALLDSLSFEYPEPVLKLFVDLLIALKPTLQELSEKQERLFYLFDLQKTSLFNFICQTATELQKNSLLNFTIFLDHAGTVFNDPKKGHCLKMLKLIDKAVQQDPSLFDAAFSSVRNGLVHKTVDVQTAIAKLILKYPSFNNGVVRQSILSVKDQMFPSAVLLLNDFLSENNDEKSIRENEPKKKKDQKKDVPNDDKITLENGVSQKYEKQRTPLIPLKSSDEILDLALRVLEKGGDSNDFELLLDGINRIHWQDAKESQSKTSPLQKKLLKLFDTFEGGMYYDTEYVEHGRAMALLLSAWCGHVERESGFIQVELSGKKIDSSLNFSTSLIGIFNEMILTSCQRLADHRTLQLLSTPTDAQGWIDPVTLVKRLPNDPEELRNYDSCDIILSLYRLAREHREEAAQLLKNYTTTENSKMYIETLRALIENREELGGQFPMYFKKAFEYDRALWKNQLPFRFNYETDQIESVPELQTELQLITSSDRLYYPIPLILKKLEYHNFDFNWGYAYLRWRLNMIPGCRPIARVIGLDYLYSKIESSSKAIEPKAFLDDLIDSDQIIDEVASLILVPALTSKSPIYSLTAEDVLISAMGQGRFRPDLFAKALRYWLEKGIPKPNRWREKFQRISTQSPLHAENVKSLFEIFGVVCAPSRHS